VVIDGRSRTFWFSGVNGTTRVSDGVHGFEVRVMDERAKLEASIFGMKPGRGAGEVRSIMPGIVTRVLVKEGDAVVPGTALLCIEAMKMENEIKAESAGIVQRVFVAAGRTVTAGEPLVEVRSS
jgi:biotin carboxyl carrier protein